MIQPYLPFIFKLLIFRRIWSEDHFESIAMIMGVVLIVIEHLFESVEVEAVSDVLLVHFAEELVVFEVAEPADPSV